MIIHKIKGQEIGYPTGLNMLDAKKFTNKVSKLLVKQIEPGKEIALYCMGSSGAILSALLFNKMSKTHFVVVHHVKKDGEVSHNNFITTYRIDSVNIIIDDMICSGHTLDRIYTGIKDSLCRFSSTIRIDYLVMSGIIQNIELFNKDIKEKIDPLNIVTTKDSANYYIEKLKIKQDTIV